MASGGPKTVIFATIGCNLAIAVTCSVPPGTLQLAELTADSKLKSVGKARVGKAPKRVAFLPAAG